MCCVSIGSASLATSLVPTVEKLIPIINNHGGVVHTISDDGRYGLDLTPLFESFENAVSHRNNDIIFSTINRNELLLTGEYRFDPLERKLAIKLFLFNGDELLFQSRLIDITSSISEAIPQYQLLFDNGFQEEQLCIRGVISDRINRAIRNGSLPDILLKTKTFKAISKNGTARLQWDESILMQWLENHFGSVIVSNSNAEVIFGNDGSVLFKLGTEQQRLTEVLPSTAIPYSQKPDGYLTAIEDFNSFSYERVTPELPIENEILNTIDRFFGEQYPSYFSNFSPDELLSLFPKLDERSVLSGTLLSDTQVRYQWRTPRNWVGRLETLHQSGRRFDVSCNVREIIQDPHSQYRFWAVVDQEWTTRDNVGSELYQDNGFLLVNFDFTSSGNLHNVALHYRLWFYNYPYKSEDDSKFSREFAILRDVQDGLNSVSGVDISLKKQVEESLLKSF